MTLIVFYASLILGTASLAMGFAPSEWNYSLPWIIAIGALWMLAQWRGWQWFPNLGLTLAVICAAFGILLELNSGWMFAGVLFPLVAWDLSAFHERMQLADVVDMPAMEKRHLVRLGILTVVGILLALLPMAIHWKFGFGWLVLLTFVAAFGFAQLVLWIRQR
jgi:hypothetical protein